MMAADDLKELFHDDFEQYVAVMNRRLRELDTAIAVMDRIDDPIADLAALGVEKPRRAWLVGVAATRIWLLDLATVLAHAVDARLPSWRGTAIAPADSPAGEWSLFTYVGMHAEGVFAARRVRKFGPSRMTPADFEEARNRLGISNEQWLALRARAEWVSR
ncbi:MAG: hypothetical protein IAI48_00615 [Candidatus Eremiobacteraeota bacterium]|nr:hypothetical protein [Candidatus Eremiobacteraeota bacterium]